MLKPFEGTLHSAEHLAWIEEGQQLQEASEGLEAGNGFPLAP